MWKGKYHMKVGRVYYLGPGVYPPRLLSGQPDSLGPAAVTAGVVMDLHMPTVTTLTYVIAQFAGFAV